MKQGAFSYLEKPFKVDEFRLTIQRALSYNEAVSENVYLRKQLKKKYQFNQLVGNSSKIQEVFKMIERVADTDSTILILGESGTGKELVARALHFNSRRQFAPFIPINCSALPENLLESELFGHRKGAFTGAVNDKKGLFQEADGGTIFLDEIGTMPPMLQSRLLRVLQEKEVRRVGDNVPIYVNVRVLAATNETLEKRVKEGLFREDLYYRLNVIPIHLPPLRDRVDDIPLLVLHFLRDKVSARTGKPFQITHKAMAVLAAHDWPGNVRELENAIERACALCDSETIKVSDLPPALHRYGETVGGTDEVIKVPETQFFHKTNEGGMATEPSAAQPPAFTQPQSAATSAIPTGRPLKDFMREQEIAYLNRVLAQTGGDKEKAAQVLGVSLATLYRKLSEEEQPV